MQREIATPFKLVLAYILLLLILAGDALEATRLNMCKIAVAARNSLLSKRSVDARATIMENQRELKTQIRFSRKRRQRTILRTSSKSKAILTPI